MNFDFSQYRIAPKGWSILRNDDELWLDQKSTGRVYKVKCPVRGEFELYYTSLVQTEDCFIMRSDSFYCMLKVAGLLLPQPNMTKAVQTRLTAKRV